MAAAKRLNKAKKAENEKAPKGRDELGGKEYERELARLHEELVKLQLWVAEEAESSRLCRARVSRQVRSRTRMGREVAAPAGTTGAGSHIGHFR